MLILRCHVSLAPPSPSSQGVLLQLLPRIQPLQKARAIDRCSITECREYSSWPCRRRSLREMRRYPLLLINQEMKIPIGAEAGVLALKPRRVQQNTILAISRRSSRLKKLRYARILEDVPSRADGAPLLRQRRSTIRRSSPESSQSLRI